MDIITGYTGTPHITAENDRDINIGIFGSKSYVLQTGTMLTAEISNNNEIKVRDGVIMHQGCAASIKKNTYDSVTINNGSQGMKRIDLLVARYEKQPETNVESLTLKVLQGTPVETSPQVPEHTEGDIQVGDTVADMPLYEVEIDGLNITEIRKVFQTMGDLESVNGKSIVESSSNGNGNYIKFGDGTLLMWGVYKGNAWITNNNAPPYYSNDIEIALPMESIAPVTYSANVVSNGVIWNCGATYQQKKTIGIRLVGVASYSNQSVSINWIACGRWM